MKTRELVQHLDLDPAGLTAEDLPELLEECAKAEAAIAAIRDRARELLAAGDQIDGWRLQPITRTEVIDPAGAFGRIWTDYGRSVALKGIKLSIPAMSAAVAEAEDISASCARNRLLKILSGMIAVHDSPRLVRSG